MFNINENTEVNETGERSEKIDDMEAELQAELDDNYEEYSNGGRSIEDIQRDKAELQQLREELVKYKEAMESNESEEEDEAPQKVLRYSRHR